MRKVEMNKEHETSPAEGKRLWTEPEISEGKSLIGQRDGLIQQAASGTTDGGLGGGLDGGLD